MRTPIRPTTIVTLRAMSATRTTTTTPSNDDVDNCVVVGNAGQLDADSDGEGDLCEYKHERSITLALKHVSVQGERMLKLSGELSVVDSASKCVKNRSVRLERYKRRADISVNVGDMIRVTNGRYSYKAPDVEGRYRARVKNRGATYSGFKSRCLAASSTERDRH